MSTEESQESKKQSSPAGFERENHSLARQSTVVASMTLVSRVSGLVRDVVLSYLFGASQVADMFFVALRIPNFFRRLFAEGAFNQAFVPVLVRYKKMGKADLVGFIAPLSGLFGFSLVIFVLLGVFFAPGLAYIFAPGFAHDPRLAQQTAELVRITFPYLGFISLTAYAGALLNAHNRFALPAFTPVLLNLSLIAGALIALSGWLNAPSVVIVAWAVLFAGVAQLTLQLPFLAGMGLLPKPTIEPKHPGVLQVGKLLVPAVFSASVGQINALVNTILASTLITGSLSWLYYADRLLELPVGLVAVALGTVMLPHLSRMAAGNDADHFKRTMDWGVNLGLLLGLPAAAALYYLALPLIAVLYMSFSNSAMTAYDVRMASYALQMFAIALPGFVLVKILAPAFFAHENTRAPVLYASGAVAVNLLGSLATFSWFGHVGLAWATALSAWMHVVLLYLGLSRRGLYRLTSRLWSMFWKIVIATLGLLGTVHGLTHDIDWLALTAQARLIWVLSLSLGGIGLYLGVLFVLGIRPKDLNQLRVSR